eukprot:11474717-Alexandrium_andersonii.AAC.1
MLQTAGTCNPPWQPLPPLPPYHHQGQGNTAVAAALRPHHGTQGNTATGTPAAGKATATPATPAAAARKILSASAS